jgi:hypothetical protein
MKEYVLRIPLQKDAFFLQLMEELGFVELVTANMEPTLYQQNEINERIYAANDGDLLDWDQVEHTL